MTLIDQIKAKKKTEKVIKSCSTREHFELVERMLEFYNNRFEDFLGYNELKRLIKRGKGE